MSKMKIVKMIGKSYVSKDGYGSNNALPQITVYKQETFHI